MSIADWLIGMSYFVILAIWGSLAIMWFWDGEA